MSERPRNLPNTQWKSAYRSPETTNKLERWQKRGAEILSSLPEEVTEKEKKGYLKKIAAMMEEDGYYVLEAFLPSPETLGASMSQEDVVSLFEDSFKLIDVQQKLGSQVYTLKFRGRK